MQSSDLRRLAKVCDLARIDIDSNAPLYLQGTEDSLAAHYRGSYSSAYRTAPSDAGEIDVVVGAKQFKAVLPLLPEGDVAVSVETTPRRVLSLRAKGSRVALAVIDQDIEPLSLSDTITAEVQVTTTDRRAGLLEEFELANQFVAKSMARPIFTGVRLTVAQDMIGLEAADGISIVYRSTMKCKTEKNLLPIRVVVPAYDFLMGLQICDGPEDILLTIEKSRIILCGNGAGFDCALLTGEWPKISLPPQAQSRRVSMPVAVLKRAVAAVKVLEGGVELKFVPGKKNIRLLAQSQVGGFLAEVPGYIDKAASFDVDALGLISGMSDESLTFDIAIDAPLHVQQGSRHVWLTNRIS